VIAKIREDRLATCSRSEVFPLSEEERVRIFKFDELYNKTGENTRWRLAKKRGISTHPAIFYEKNIPGRPSNNRRQNGRMDGQSPVAFPLLKSSGIFRPPEDSGTRRGLHAE
jgi:hypothetical protein